LTDWILLKHDQLADAELGNANEWELRQAKGLK